MFYIQIQNCSFTLWYHTWKELWCNNTGCVLHYKNDHVEPTIFTKYLTEVSLQLHLEVKWFCVVCKEEVQVWFWLHLALRRLMFINPEWIVCKPLQKLIKLYVYGCGRYLFEIIVHSFLLPGVWYSNLGWIVSRSLQKLITLYVYGCGRRFFWNYRSISSSVQTHHLRELMLFCECCAKEVQVWSWLHLTSRVNSVKIFPRVDHIVHLLKHLFGTSPRRPQNCCWFGVAPELATFFAKRLVPGLSRLCRQINVDLDDTAT